jgi:hypothetical protein
MDGLSGHTAPKRPGSAATCELNADLSLPLIQQACEDRECLIADRADVFLRSSRERKTGEVHSLIRQLLLEPISNIPRSKSNKNITQQQQPWTMSTWRLNSNQLGSDNGVAVQTNCVPRSRGGSLSNAELLSYGS